jgi:hypothetical protein
MLVVRPEKQCGETCLRERMVAQNFILIVGLETDVS